MDGIYDKLFPFIEKSAFLEEDKQFLRICETLDFAFSKPEEGIIPECDIFETLQIPKAFQCEYSDAVNYLSENLKSGRNPFDKMKCLKTTQDLIVAIINKNHSGSKTEFVTTDDMIPLFSLVIIKAKIPNLITNLNYMQDYQLEEEHGMTEFGFSVTTLFASIQFIKTEIYAKDETKWKKFKPKLTTTTNQSPAKNLDLSLLTISPKSASNQSEPVNSSFNTTNNSESNDLVSALISPRDSRSLAMRQRRQEEREKRMSLRKMETMEIISSFEERMTEKQLSSFGASSSNDNARSSPQSSSSLTRQNSMPSRRNKY